MSIGQAQVALLCDVPLAEATTFTRDQLGPSLLAAIAASRMGVETAFVTEVGDDAFSDWMLETWDAERLHLDHVRRLPGANTMVLTSRQREARGTVVHPRTAAEPAPETSLGQLPWEMTAFGYAAGCLQGSETYAREALVLALRKAQSLGARTAYNPCLSSESETRLTGDAFDDIAPVLDLLIIRAPFGTGTLLGEPSPAAAAQAAHKRGIGHVVIRDANGGCLCSDEGGVFESPGTLNTLHPAMDGAFDGVLLAGLARGLSLRAAMRVASSLLQESAAKAQAGLYALGIDALPRAWPTEDGSASGHEVSLYEGP